MKGFVSVVTGSLLAEGIEISEWLLSLALHATAGIIIAVVGTELMPEIMRGGPGWLVTAAFLPEAWRTSCYDIALAHLRRNSGFEGFRETVSAKGTTGPDHYRDRDEQGSCRKLKGREITGWIRWFLRC